MKFANEESKNTWFSKTLSSIREATKKIDQSNQGHQMNRDNSKDFE